MGEDKAIAHKTSGRVKRDKNRVTSLFLSRNIDNASAKNFEAKERARTEFD